LLQQQENLLAEFSRFALAQKMALPEDDASLSTYTEQLNNYVQLLPEVLPAEQWQVCQQREEQLLATGVAEEFARRFAVLGHLNGFLPLVGLVGESSCGLDSLIRLNSFITGKLKTAELFACLESVPVRNSWDRSARESIIGSARKVILQLIQSISVECQEDPERFFRSRRQEYRMFTELRDKLLSETPGNFHPYTVLLAALEGILLD